MTADLGSNLALLASITRDDVAHYVSALIWVYTIVILIKVLLSWVPRMPYNPVVNAVVRFIDDVTEPYLGLFRRLIPSLQVGGGGLDVSPMIAVFVLVVVGGLVVSLIAG